MSEYREKNIRGEVVQLRRIADTLDTIVAMIKEDQERSKKYTTYSKNEDDFMGSENRIENE